MREKTILCYGDSNTWGRNPFDGTRFDRHERWTGLVAMHLGQSFSVIEDGLNGRTSVYDDPNGRCFNGEKGLGYALIANKPLDCVVLMLGTNDLKFTDARGAARGAETLIRMILQANDLFSGTSPVFYHTPKILLISPIHIGKEIERLPSMGLLRGKREASLQMAKEYERVALQYGTDFLDASLFAHPSPADCIHMDQSSHMMLADAVSSKIKLNFASP